METQSDKIDMLIPALVKAQSEMKFAEKDGTNPHFKSKYSSYESIRSVCKKPLSDNGLSLTHHLDVEDGKRVLITQVTHISGQWMRSYLMLPQVEKESPQAVGSSISYSKRYTLSSLLAICTCEDDYGETVEQLYREPICLTETQIYDIAQLIGSDDAIATRILKAYQVDSFKKISSNAYSWIIKRVKEEKGL
jgi:hypothetical protein